ncbi:MAG: hypothetical protein LBF95_08320 [Treponema sp.]|nr:hypothetical protein [Treponema sp.]
MFAAALFPPAGSVYGVFADVNVGSITENRATAPDARIEITGDAVSADGQRNVYSFVPPLDGRYRFELAGLRANATVGLYVYNYLGETVNYGVFGNGYGLTLDGLVQGRTYEIHVR